MSDPEVEVVTVPNYSPEQEARRSELLRSIREINAEYRAAIQPYLDELAKIEARHVPKIYLVPRPDE